MASTKTIYRGPKRGPARTCSQCGETHHSAVYDTCGTCRAVPRVLRLRRQGRCVAGIRGCQINWRHLDHDHCPDCRRPMAPGQPRCAKCDALLILQAPAPTSRPQLRGELRPAQLQSLGEDMARLDRLGYAYGHEADVRESFDELPDE